MYTIYCYSKCNTCKKALKYLEKKEIKYQTIDLSKESIDIKKLTTFYKSGKYPLKKFFNTSGLIYKNMGLKDKLKEMSEKDALNLLSKEGMLLKRPFLISKDKFVIGFKEEEWDKFI